MKNKKVLILLLVILSLFVWGRNVYLIFSSGGDPEKTVSGDAGDIALSDSMIVSTGDKAASPYQGRNRDPFQSWLVAAAPKPKAPRAQTIKRSEPAVPPPVLRFSGILQDGEGSMAVVEGQGGSTYFVHEKDTVEGVLIMAIEKDSLVCRFQKRTYRIGLGR